MSDSTKAAGKPPRPPVPVRTLMKEGDSRLPRPGPVRGSAGGETAKAVGASEAVEVQVDGEAWVVRVAGRARSGVSAGVGAPLLFLSFARAEDPDAPLREIFAAGTDVAAFPEERLVELFRGSRPWSPPAENEEDLPRGRRGKGRGPRRGR